MFSGYKPEVTPIADLFSAAQPQHALKEPQSHAEVLTARGVQHAGCWLVAPVEVVERRRVVKEVLHAGQMSLACQVPISASVSRAMVCTVPWLPVLS